MFLIVESDVREDWESFSSSENFFDWSFELLLTIFKWFVVFVQNLNFISGHFSINFKFFTIAYLSVRFASILRVLLLRMQELASKAVGTIQIFMKLFAKLSLIIIRNMLLLLEFVETMRERAAVIEFTVSIQFPISAHLCFILNSETFILSGFECGCILVIIISTIYSLAVEMRDTTSSFYWREAHLHWFFIEIVFILRFFFRQFL